MGNSPLLGRLNGQFSLVGTAQRTILPCWDGCTKTPTVSQQTKMSANTDHATSSLTVPTQWEASTAPVFRVMMETDSHVMVRRCNSLLFPSHLSLNSLRPNLYRNVREK